jgi:hypothetical protein
MKPMRHAIKVCALFITLSVFSGATCRRSTGAGESGAGAQSKNMEASVQKRGGAANDSEGKPPEDPFARIPRMTVQELKKALDEGTAVVADVRPSEAFEEEHIVGAFSIPEEDWAQRAGDLPKDKLVVAYCA